MTQQVEAVDQELMQKIISAKDGSERKFKTFTGSFYILKSALRYFSIKKGMSFTSSKIADNFPVSAPVAGSSLKILAELDVVEPRTSSSSPNRYMPENVDLERMEQIQEILIENFEIKEFKPED